MGATIYERPGELWRFAVATEYSEAYVEQVKALPSRARKWNAAAKVWLFKADMIDAVLAILTDCYGGYTWGPVAPALETAYGTLHLLPSAPAGLVKLAYRYWAKELHPDTGGDTAAMQRVNVAVEAIELAGRGK